LHRAMPLAANVRRPTAAPWPYLAGQYKNLRPPLAYAPRTAPRDPRELPAPTRASRMPVFLYTAIGAFKAVSSQDNFVRLYAPNPHAAQPRGTMTPFRRYGNIRNERPTAFGSQWILDPSGEGLTATPMAGMP
jgi:hypothetical protein